MLSFREVKWLVVAVSANPRGREAETAFTTQRRVAETAFTAQKGHSVWYIGRTPNAIHVHVYPAVQDGVFKRAPRCDFGGRVEALRVRVRAPYTTAAKDSG